MLINGVIGGRLLGKQYPRIGAKRACEGQELVECDALVAGFDVGEGRAAHVAVLGNSLLGEPTLAAQPPQGGAQFPVLGFNLLHLAIMPSRACIVNHTDTPGPLHMADRMSV